jgi:glutaredoxin
MYLLVGLIEWESQHALIAQKKMPNCDLISVYSDQDKDRLKSDESHVDWDVLKAMEDSQKVVKCETSIHFTEEEEYKVSTDSSSTTAPVIICDGEEAVNVDDI